MDMGGKPYTTACGVARPALCEANLLARVRGRKRKIDSGGSCPASGCPVIRPGLMPSAEITSYKPTSHY